MKNYWISIYPWIKNHISGLVFTFLLAIPLGLIKGYQTYIIKDLFDKGFASNASSESAYRLAFIIISLQIINYPIRYFHFYWIKVLSEKISNGIRLHLFNHLIRLPLSYHQKQKQGELLSTIQSDVSLVSESIRFLPALAREPLTAICLLCVALYHDWQLTLILFLAVPMFVLIFNTTGKKIRVRVSEVQQAIAKFTHVLSEGIAGQKMIKANNLQHFSSKRLKKTQDEYMETYKKCASIEEQSSPLIEIVAALALGGIIIYAHNRISSGDLTTGAFISFMAAMAFFMDPVRKYTDAFIKMQRGKGALDRIMHLLKIEEEKTSGSHVFPSHFKNISLKGINFSYDSIPILKNFSLNIKSGEKVALVGLSGSGKSTLINLLLRFYQPQSGQIDVDGTEVQNIDLSSYRKNFALVSQDLFLFNDSIQENLATGNDVTEKSLWDALTTANATDFVSQLPEKLSTSIGDKGVRLSGGQAQRITIARALLQNAPILLLDEATSALDNESEKIVQKAIDKLSQERTVITIAHRLSTIQNYDKIVVLKAGEKLEEGTHQELLTKNGEYKKLFDLGQI